MKSVRTLGVALMALTAVAATQSSAHAQNYEQAARHAKILTVQSKQAYSYIMQLGDAYQGYRDPMRVDDRDVFKQSVWIYEHFPQGAANHDGMVARANRIRADIKRLLIQADKVLVTAANNGDSETKGLAYELIDQFKAMDLHAKAMQSELTGQ